MDNLLAALNWENTVSLVSLAAMEIVLGIDNVIFIAILSQRLPPAERSKVRKIGLALALVLRLGLLFTLSWLMGLTKPLITLMGHGLSGRHLVLLIGGLFLVGKSAHEIYDKLEGPGEEHGSKSKGGAFAIILVQILLLDVVFSLDSVITAVGMVKSIPIMATAMIIAVIVMLIFADSVSNFINRHPSMKVLALSFLLLIGTLLIAEGFGKHLEKGYVYFAMGFAFFIELLNLRLRRKHKPVVLHQKFDADPAAPQG